MSAADYSHEYAALQLRSDAEAWIQAMHCPELSSLSLEIVFPIRNARYL